MRLRAKTLLPVAILSVSFLVFLYGFWFPRSLRNVEEQALQAAEQHLDSVAAGLAPLLLVHQLDAVYENLDSALEQNPAWLAVRLVDPLGHGLYPLRDAPPPAPPGRDVRTLTRNVAVRGADLGRIALTFDLSSVTAEVGRRHDQLAVVLILVFCGSFAGIIIVLERVVRRPVGILARAAERVAQGDFGTPLVRTGHDEVGTLVDAFARMRASIQDYQARQAESARAITRLSQDLERRVAERTAQLEAANKELEAFAYSTSHDLRAPLRHIAGFVSLLEQRSDALPDDKCRHYLAEVAGAAARMDRLIEDLLSFSRMGRQEMSGMEVDLGVLVKEVIRELEPECRGRDVRWLVDSLPVVHGDRAMLRVVFVNLLSNALKFTRRRPSATIEVGGAPADSEAVVFVRDNGAGFDQRFAGKLFGVFQRLHRADEFEGSGIGLANVRRIISRHGGRAWAEGKPDEGATFYFSVPGNVEVVTRGDHSGAHGR